MAWTRAALRATGIGETALRRAVRRGELVRVGHDRFDRPGPSDVETLIAAPGSGVALRGLSAARAWGLPAPRGPVEALVRRGCRRPALPASAELRTTRRWDVFERDGVLVTDLARTCADVAGEHPLEVVVPILDAALRVGLDPSDVTAHARAGVAGSAEIARALRHADVRAESPLESRLRVLLTVADLPPMDLQHIVRDRDAQFVGRVDLWYSGVVVEADGFAFHSSREDYRRDRQKGVEYARLGLLVLRFSWEQVVGAPDYVVAAVRDAVHCAGLPPALPPVARRSRPTT